MSQFLTFSIDHIVYAFNVNCVQEVLEYTEPAKIPCVADYVEGLINSRNQGISLINLRKRFGLETKVPDKKTRVIVTELPDPTDADPKHVQLFGALADSVNEVVDIDDDKMEPPPKFGNAIPPEFISGLSKVNDVFVSILNPEKIFSGYVSLPQDDTLTNAPPTPQENATLAQQATPIQAQ